MAKGMAAKLKEAAGETRTGRRADPRSLLRDLAENAGSEAARVSAARALVELQAGDRKRREEGRPENPLEGLSDEEVRQLADEEAATNLKMILTGGGLAEHYPQTSALVEDLMRRQVEARVRSELAAIDDAAEFERRVEARAAEIAAGIAERKVEHRLRELSSAEVPPAEAAAAEAADTGGDAAEATEASAAPVAPVAELREPPNAWPGDRDEGRSPFGLGPPRGSAGLLPRDPLAQRPRA